MSKWFSDQSVNEKMDRCLVGASVYDKLNVLRRDSLGQDWVGWVVPSLITPCGVFSYQTSLSTDC